MRRRYLKGEEKGNSWGEGGSQLDEDNNIEKKGKILMHIQN